VDADAAGRAADLLLAARRDGRRMAALPDDCRPADAAAAYRIQNLFVERMQAEYGGEVIGYKAGCTNRGAQAQLGLTAPFAGVLLSAFCRPALAEISCRDGFMRMIEAEIAFRLGRDLPPAGAPYDAASVVPALAAALPAVEVVDSRYDDWTTAGAPHLIADNACTGFWVHGEEITDLAGLEFADHPVLVRRNGQPAERGSSANVLDNPLNVVAWLANHQAAAGRSLRAGQLLTTGTLIAVNPAERGDEVEADFGALGSVTVRFT
jgi:2-keto-4-pentenoate hydratase